MIGCFCHLEVPNVAFCVHCGRPLCDECVRSVRGTVYCETCLGEVVGGEGKNGKIISIKDRFRRDEGGLEKQESQNVPASGFEEEGPSLAEITQKGRRRGGNGRKNLTKLLVTFLILATLVGGMLYFVARRGRESGEQEAAKRPAARKPKAEEPATSDCTMKVQMSRAPFLRIPLPPEGCDIRNALVAPVVIRLDVAGEQGEFIAAPRGPMFKIVDGVEEPSSWKVLEGASEIWVRAKEEPFLFRLSPEAGK